MEDADNPAASQICEGKGAAASIFELNLKQYICGTAWANAQQSFQIYSCFTWHGYGPHIRPYRSLTFDPTPQEPQTASHSTLPYQKYATLQGKNNISRFTFDPTSFQASKKLPLYARKHRVSCNFLTLRISCN